MGLVPSVYPVDVDVDLGTVTTPIVVGGSILINSITITRELLGGSTGLFRVYFALTTSNNADYELEINRKRSGSEQGIGAAGTVTIANGLVNGIDITDPGAGYPAGATTASESVIVFINAGTGGTGALAVPIIERGEIVDTTIINPGSGYTSPPLVIFVSSGTAANGENLKFNADNNFILKSLGYYRFDIGVRVGDIIDFVYQSSEGTPPTITTINEFRIDQIQIGA